jgi:hypothetical protein
VRFEPQDKRIVCIERDPVVCDWASVCITGELRAIKEDSRFRAIKGNLEISGVAPVVLNPDDIDRIMPPLGRIRVGEAPSVLIRLVDCPPRSTPMRVMIPLSTCVGSTSSGTIVHPCGAFCTCTTAWPLGVSLILTMTGFAIRLQGSDSATKATMIALIEALNLFIIIPFLLCLVV